MAGKNVLTTRIGDTVKVEINDPFNPYGTVPNYGNVRPDSLDGFYWFVSSGQHGTTDTESKAINAAARAIRDHAARHTAAHIGIDYSGGACDNCGEVARVIWNLHLSAGEDHEALCQNCLPDPMPHLPHQFA